MTPGSHIRAQRGASLIIVVILLVVLMISALALVRSSEATETLDATEA